MAPDALQIDRDGLTVARGVISRSRAGGSCHALASHHRGFFISEGDHFQRMPQLILLTLKCSSHLQASQNAKGTIKAAAGRHRIEVRSSNQSGEPGFSPIPPADQIAGGVNTDAQPSLRHPSGHQLAPLTVVCRKAPATDAAISLAPHLGQRLDGLLKTIAIRLNPPSQGLIE